MARHSLGIETRSATRIIAAARAMSDSVWSAATIASGWRREEAVHLISTTSEGSKAEFSWSESKRSVRGACR
jgi:hypothetical protein